MTTIFEKIIAGEIPCHKVAEDEHTLVFMDINPASKGHMLVVPKRGGADVLDTDPEAVAAVARMAQRMAQLVERVLNPDGINILQNSRLAAGQTVMYYHVHVIPRWDDDKLVRWWQPGATDHATLDALAAELRAAAE